MIKGLVFKGDMIILIIYVVNKRILRYMSKVDKVEKRNR